MTTFDARHWYRISRYTNSGNGSLTAFVAENTVGTPDTSVFFSPDNGNNLNYFRWQLFPTTNDIPPPSYAMRPWSSPGGYLNAIHNSDPAAATCDDQNGVDTLDCTTVGHLLPVIDLAALWNITSTNDGVTPTFYLSNAQNGSDYRLDLWPNQSWVRMSNNITGDQPTQKFQIIDMGPITDPTFYNISSNSLLQYPGANETFPYAAAVNQVPSVTTTSTSPSIASTTTTTPSPITTSTSPTPIPHHQTPVGAIVGGVVGGACLVALIAGIWFLLRRRKARSQAAYHQANSGQQSPMAMTDIPPTYEDEPRKPNMVVEETTRPLTGTSSQEAQEMSGEGTHEMPAQQMERVEMLGEGRRYELPG